MAVRLPAPGSDADQWGGILNEFLEVSHNSDGTLKSSALSSSGGTTRSVTVKTSDYSLTVDDDIILVDASSSPVTIALPTATGNNREYTIKKTDASANTVTILPVSGQTIDDGPTSVLGAQYASVSVVSDTTNWFVL